MRRHSSLLPGVGITAAAALLIAISSSLVVSALPTHPQPRPQPQPQPWGQILNVHDHVSQMAASRPDSPTSDSVQLSSQDFELPDDSQAEQELAATANDGHLNSTLTFDGKRAATYAVGHHIPGIPFAVKNSWAGLVPTAKSANLSPKSLSGLVNDNDTRSLYFWLWGSEGKTGSDDLTIWLNGGPGCSSLSGFLQENGPIRWSNRNESAHKSKYSWTEQSNMLWVEQPIGTGFSRGKPTATNEKDIAKDFYGFLLNFYKIFPELKGKKLYITGESYAGAYIPAITSYIQSQKDTFNIQGNLIIDGVVTDSRLQMDVVVLDYVQANNDKLNLTDGQIGQIKADSDRCGYTGFTEKNLHYPPHGKLPTYNSSGCNTFDQYSNATMEQNKYFDVYNIAYKGPPGFFDNNILGDPNSNVYGPTYFGRREVQDYIHAPHITWKTCTRGVFPTGDHSAPPDQTVLPGVIEKNKRTIIANGQLDGLIITNGSLLGMQNMTWNGKQGFSRAPTTPLIGTTGKHEGTYVTERGLTFAIVDRAGHMIPEDRPPAGLALLKYLLGRGSLSDD